MAKVLCLIAVLVASHSRAVARAPRISSLSRDGALVCTNLQPGTSVEVQWASALGGSWTNSWASLHEIRADSNGIIRVHVPVIYRVLVNPPSGGAPPIADAGPDQIAEEYTAVVLDGSASSDADGDIASYAWIQKAGTRVSIVNSSSVQPAFTTPGVLPEGENLVFELVITDANGFQASDTAVVRVLPRVIWPDLNWPTSSPEDIGMSPYKLAEARDYALTGGGSGFIVRGGRLVMSWGNSDRLYDVKSSTKSIGITALGLAIGDGLMRIQDKAKEYHSNLESSQNSEQTANWAEDVTLFQLATHTAGFDKHGGYTELLFPPGSEWSYSDGGANWLAECITLTYREDLDSKMYERVFSVIGINRSALTWRDNLYRSDTIQGIKNREFGSGIRTTVDAMARIGYLYLRGGKWRDVQVIPESFVDAVQITDTELAGVPVRDPVIHFNASDHYGLLWWNNSDGTLAKVPRDAYWSWGLWESFIVVIPSLDIVATRAGDGWRIGWDSDYSILAGFLEPIVASMDFIAPIADAGRDKTVEERVLVTLNGSGSYDAEEDIASYEWVQKGGPTVSLTGAFEARAAFVAPDVGPEGDLLTFELTVVDASGLRSRDNCAITVIPAAAVMPSSNRNGELVCVDLKPEGVVGVEWASTVEGPWRNSWSGLSAIWVNASGSIEASVPMIFRVTESSSIATP